MDLAVLDTDVASLSYSWLGNKPVLPYDAHVAWRWGQLIASAERRGVPAQ